MLPHPPKAAGPTSQLQELANDYLQDLAVANYSPTTRKQRRTHLTLFVNFCQERAITTVALLTPQLLERYHQYLVNRKIGERSLAAGYIYQQLLSLQLWCGVLADKKLLPVNIAQRLALPRFKKHIPIHVLTPQQIWHVLQQPDTSSHMGTRDRAILETLASTGMRRQELLALTLNDLDWQQATVLISHGKGNKQRLIPIARTALAWIEKYLTHVRPLLLTDHAPEALFLNTAGRPLSCTALAAMVARYLKAAKLTTKGGCHLFRYALATAMLDNGADIRYVQQMLGHRDLQATQEYTKVSIRKLKQVHSKTHPAKLKPSAPEQEKPSAPEQER